MILHRCAMMLHGRFRREGRQPWRGGKHRSVSTAPTTCSPSSGDRWGPPADLSPQRLPPSASPWKRATARGTPRRPGLPREVMFASDAQGAVEPSLPAPGQLCQQGVCCILGRGQSGPLMVQNRLCPYLGALLRLPQQWKVWLGHSAVYFVAESEDCLPCLTGFVPGTPLLPGRNQPPEALPPTQHQHSQTFWGRDTQAPQTPSLGHPQWLDIPFWQAAGKK